MWTRSFRVFPISLRRAVDAEKIAAATILAIMVLAGVDAIQRTRPPERAGGFDIARPAVPGIGHAHATARAAELAAKRRAEGTPSSALEFKTVEAPTVQAQGQAPLNGKGMLSTLERMQSEVKSRTGRGFHRTAAVILDATGSPALNPHRGSSQPFKLKVIARVTDGFDVAVADPTNQPRVAAPAAPVTTTVRPLEKAAAGVRGKRTSLGPEKTPAKAAVKASVTLTGTVSQPVRFKTNKNSSQETVVAQISPSTAKQPAVHNRLRDRADLSPGEITWRALRGPT